jgi:hypothetical protein
MGTTEESVSFAKTHWNLVRVFPLLLLSLVFALLLATFPAALMLLVSAISGLGLLIGSWSILKANRMWAQGALITSSFLFIVAIMVRLTLGSILQALPSLLLAYVMLLFSVEAFDLVWKHAVTYSREMFALQSSRVIPVVQKSLEHIFRRLRNLGLMFGACYLVALGALSLGDLFASISPVLSDVSIYIVAVSIALALLLILRED